MTDLTKPDKKKQKQQEAILASLEMGASIVAACKAAGITASCLWLWRKADQEFNAKVDAAIESRIMIVEDALYVAAFLDRNPSALFFFLQNRAPDRWKDMRQLNVTGKVIHAIEKTDEELDEIAAKYFGAYLEGYAAAGQGSDDGKAPATADNQQSG